MKNGVVHFVENFLRKPLIFSNICVTHTHTHLPSNPTHPHLVFAAKVANISGYPIFSQRAALGYPVLRLQRELPLNHSP